MDIKIRELKKDDTEVIEFIKNRLSERWRYSKNEIEQDYINKSFLGGFPYIYIAFDENGEFVGKIFLCFEEKNYLNINNQLWINALLVKEEYRGQGVAQKLIKKTEEKAKDLGYAELYLDTADSEGYYKKIGGWETIGKDLWERGNEELTIMRKILSN